jgi:hypothetical protein
MAEDSTTGVAAEISVLTADINDPDAVVRGLFRRLDEIRYGRIKISTVELRTHLDEFLRSMDKIIGELPSDIGGFSLDSVSLAVEISAKGTVTLLGTGGELAGKGGVTFTLKRSRPVG